MFSLCLGQQLARNGLFCKVWIFQTSSFSWLLLCTPSAPLSARRVPSLTTELYSTLERPSLPYASSGWLSQILSGVESTRESDSSGISPKYFVLKTL